jgi:hypothetical protein
MRGFTMGFALAAIFRFCAFTLLAFAPASEMAHAESFATPADAEAFLSRAIPAATAANPRYRSAGSDVETRWLTKSISFQHSESGGVIGSTDEEFERYRGGKLISRGTHQATFAIDAVAVSLETSDQDTTENGEKAEGVMFRCVGAPCIDSVWDGKKSTSAWTDVYLHDPEMRERIFTAFMALQKKGNAK